MTPTVTVRFRWLRWAAGFGLGFIFLFGYATLTYYNYHRFEVLGEPSISLALPIDAALPVVPVFVWAYCLYLPFLFLPLLVVHTPRDLAAVLLAFLLANVVAWICYVAIPVRMQFPTVDCLGVSCDLIRAWHRDDVFVNVMPSMHTGGAVLVARIHWLHRAPGRPLVIGVAAAIVASTVLIKQHYIVDLPPGFVLGWVAYPLARKILSWRRTAPSENVAEST